MQRGRRRARSVSRRAPRPPPWAPSPAPRRPSPVAREGRHRVPPPPATLSPALAFSQRWLSLGAAAAAHAARRTPPAARCERCVREFGVNYYAACVHVREGGGDAGGRAAAGGRGRGGRGGRGGGPAGPRRSPRVAAALSEYELERLKNIQDNKRKLQALGLEKASPSTPRLRHRTGPLPPPSSPPPALATPLRRPFNAPREFRRDAAA